MQRCIIVLVGFLMMFEHVQAQIVAADSKKSNQTLYLSTKDLISSASFQRIKKNLSNKEVGVAFAAASISYILMNRYKAIPLQEEVPETKIIPLKNNASITKSYQTIEDILGDIKYIENINVRNLVQIAVSDIYQNLNKKEHKSSLVDILNEFFVGAGEDIKNNNIVVGEKKYLVKAMSESLQTLCKKIIAEDASLRNYKAAVKGITNYVLENAAGELKSRTKNIKFDPMNSNKVVFPLSKKKMGKVGRVSIMNIESKIPKVGIVFFALMFIERLIEDRQKFDERQPPRGLMDYNDMNDSEQNSFVIKLISKVGLARLDQLLEDVAQSVSNCD